MAKKEVKPPTGRTRPRRKPHFVERVARRMVSLANRVVQDPESTAQLGQLTELIEKYLAAGQDQVIDRALEQAPDPATHEEILDDVLACTEWQTVIDPDGEITDLILFAVPLQLTLHTSARGRSVPASVPDITALVQSFRRHALVGEEPGVMLHNYFYSLDELSTLPFSKRYLLPMRMLKASDSTRPIDLFQRQEPVNLASSQAHVLLRFMLGLVIQSPRSPHPFLDPEEDDEVLTQRGLDWINAFAREVEDQLQEPNLEVMCIPSLPAPLQAALQDGYEQHRELTFQLVVTRVVEQWGDPDGLRAFVKPPAETSPEAIMITLIDQESDTLLLRYAWQLAHWDDPEESFDRIGSILNQTGIHEFRVGDRPPSLSPYLH